MSKRSSYTRRIDTGFSRGVLTLAALLLNGPAALASSSDSVIRDEWTDPDTSHRVIRLSRIPGESESFYFHQNAFTATGDKMVFANTSTNHSRDFFAYDWRTQKLDKLTAGGTNRGEIVAPKSRQLFYIAFSTTIFGRNRLSPAPRHRHIGKFLAGRAGYN